MPLSKNQKLFLIVIASITISFTVTGILYYTTAYKPIKRYNFYGNQLEFRDDLRYAQNISIYPNEESILYAIWDPEILNVTIAFTDTPDNQIVAVNAFEIAYKLRIAYLTFNWDVPINGMEVESFENLTGDRQHLIIALVPPYLTNETGVEMRDSVIYVKGKTYEDFDRATIKFLMAAMNITV